MWGFQCVVGCTEIFSRQISKWLIPAFCWHKSCKVVPWAGFQMKNSFVLIYFFSWICSVVCFVHISVKMCVDIMLGREHEDKEMVREEGGLECNLLFVCVFWQKCCLKYTSAIALITLGNPVEIIQRTTQVWKSDLNSSFKCTL